MTAPNDSVRLLSETGARAENGRERDRGQLGRQGSCPAEPGPRAPTENIDREPSRRKEPRA
jgi:hypothetical protein